LTGRLAPDFKTIADFRKDNGKAIRLVCREFVMLYRKLELFTDAFVAIDGSKFKAVNNRDRNFTRAKLKRRLQQIDESIERYLGQIASADRQEAAVAKDKTQRLESKIATLKKEMARLKKLEVRMLQAPDQQISLTDPDAVNQISRPIYRNHKHPATWRRVSSASGILSTNPKTMNTRARPVNV